MTILSSISTTNTEKPIVHLNAIFVSLRLSICLVWIHVLRRLLMKLFFWTQTHIETTRSLTISSQQEITIWSWGQTCSWNIPRISLLLLLVFQTLTNPTIYRNEEFSLKMIDTWWAILLLQMCGCLDTLISLRSRHGFEKTWMLFMIQPWALFQVLCFERMVLLEYTLELILGILKFDFGIWISTLVTTMELGF